jgi:hypothetical protein
MLKTETLGVKSAIFLLRDTFTSAHWYEKIYNQNKKWKNMSQLRSQLLAS